MSEIKDDQFILGQGDATQTTTSYRSGRSLPSDEEDELNELSKASNLAGVVSRLRDQKLRGARSLHDTGHPFSTEMRFVENFRRIKSLNVEGGTTIRYDGAVYPIQTLFGGSRFIAVSSFNSGYYGTKAINATMPTRPAASLLTSLLEGIKDGLPSMIGSALKKAKDPLRGYSEEFLNLQFGIRPVLQDMRKAALTILEMDDQIRQYNRDSGKTVRRGFTFPRELSTTWVGGQGGQLIGCNTGHAGVKPWTNSAGTPISSVFGTQVETVTTSRRIWFAGGYTYLSAISPKGKHLWDEYVKGAIHFLGLEASLETLWDVLPWSWLFDWKFNMGDLLGNLDYLQYDDQVLRYGYLMCDTKITHEVTCTKTTVTNSGPSGSFTISYVTRRKERVRANPYGFSTVPGSFSPKQWAILAALGITRAPNILFD